MDFQALSTAYTGEAAAGYDARRAPTTKWLTEDETVRDLLRVLPPGASVLDVPVGTGRFLELYQERGFKVAGRDISPDMLRAAQGKLNELDGLDCSLDLADIRTIPEYDGQFDCALSVRFLNWVDARGLEDSLRELRRVSKRYLIVGVRHWVPPRDLLLNGPKGLRRFLRRYLIDLRRSARDWFTPRPLRKARTNQHEREVVLHTFSKLGLRIDAQHLVEHGRDGTDYFLYRLVKETV
jgi:ubiquinone/menaquinone biosynthesis C-methylase UbiE